MSEFPEEFSILAKELCENEKVYFYSLYEKYKLSPPQIVQFIKYINSQNSITYIIIEEQGMYLTEYGRAFIIENKKDLYLHTGFDEKITFEGNIDQTKIQNYVPSKEIISKLD